MDGVVNTAMAGGKTAQHGTVGGVDDGISGKAGNITLPENQLMGWCTLGRDVYAGFFCYGRQFVGDYHTFVGCFFPQQDVLLPQEVSGYGAGVAQVHQGTQQPSLGVEFIGESGGICLILGHFLQQYLIEVMDSF